MGEPRLGIFFGTTDNILKMQAQIVAVDRGQLVVIIRQAITARIQHQGRDERAGANLRETEIHRRQHPGFLHPLNQQRREHRLALITGFFALDRALNRLLYSPGIHTEVREYHLKVMLRVFDQLEQHVLDGDFIVGARDAGPGGGLH